MALNDGSAGRFSPKTVKIFKVCAGALIGLVGAIGWLAALFLVLAAYISKKEELRLDSIQHIRGADATKSALQMRQISITGPLRTSQKVGDGVFVKPNFILLKTAASELVTVTRLEEKRDSEGHFDGYNTITSTEWHVIEGTAKTIWAKDLSVDGLDVDLSSVQGSRYIQVEGVQLEPSLMLDAASGWEVHDSCLYKEKIRHCFEGIREGQEFTVFGYLSKNRVVSVPDIGELVMGIGNRDTAFKNYHDKLSTDRFFARVTACGLSIIALMIFFYGLELLMAIYEHIPDYKSLCDTDEFYVVGMYATMASIWPAAVSSMLGMAVVWWLLIAVLGLFLFLFLIPRRGREQAQSR